jgi:hypothetical protein
MFGASAYRIVLRVGRDLGNSRHVNLLCLFAEQIDNPPHNLGTHTESREPGLVLGDDICTGDHVKWLSAAHVRRSFALGFAVSALGLNAAISRLKH